MEQHEEKNPLDPLRDAKRLAGFIKNPEKAVVSALVRSAIEKKGHLSPIKIYQELNTRFGQEWWDWEPETIWQMVDSLATEELKNIVMALQCIVNTEFPFEHWHVFEKVGQALNLQPVAFGILQPLEPHHASLTIYLLKTIRPKAEFEPEVLGYVAAVLHDAGITWAPPMLFGSRTEEHLRKIAPDHSGIGALTAKEWPAKESSNPAVKLQLAKLHAIEAYLKERL
jgi:hypothetical protein